MLFCYARMADMVPVVAEEMAMGSMVVRNRTYVV